MTLVASDLGIHRFAGRRQELRTLQRMLDVARSGGHPVMAVTGAPRIGKSRLFGELIKRARAKGFWVLRGQGSELEDRSSRTALETAT